MVRKPSIFQHLALLQGFNKAKDSSTEIGLCQEGTETFVGAGRMQSEHLFDQQWTLALLTIRHFYRNVKGFALIIKFDIVEARSMHCEMSCLHT